MHSERCIKTTTTTKKYLGSLTVDAARLIAVVRTVVNLVALLGAVYAGTVAALELIGSARQQGCKRKTYTHTYTCETGLVDPV